ncbi:hypothetical protein D1159_12415 [Pseudoflavonifractor sp. 524-17]|uniref:stalk domain-containing protein n=1 Tax=Pseudoflavonifractor sp. 524-17 TaxID=2304577 RepID=UPI00137ADE89|nr:stalk domain-containing protein [Pseudoflavonifractor sp. 524-17]NCE65358.1 hypothetical protein [Pseudoflavonifractor sp. 524-17]
MKKKKLVSALALTLALLCAFTLGAGASSKLQEIKAYLNADITVKLDGKPQSLIDANGARIYPITYNGSTYLPVRAISNILGVGVGWDQSTQSVLLGKQPNGVDLIDTYDIYHTEKRNSECVAGQVKTADEKTESISGITQSHWIYLNCAWGAGITVSYNLQGKHDTLTFSYYSDRDVVLKVLGDDNSILGEYAITGGEVAKTVTLPLFRTKELKFEVVANNREWPQVRIMDAYLDAEQ